MDDPGSIILYLFLIVGCAYFAGTEISLASVNRIHMMSSADKGNRRAARVLRVLDRFDEALSVLLIGNNVMNIGCATLTVVIARREWGTGAVAWATIATTVILFIFGEMLPKCFARSCNEQFAMAASGPLLVLMKIIKPLSLLFTAISSWVSKPFVNRVEPEVTMTQDELQDIVENISPEDGFDEDTGKLVQSAMKFADLTTEQIMVPWEEVLTVKTSMKTPEILDTVRGSVHSRIPVIGRNGTVKGILQIRKFLRAYIHNEHVILASVTDFPYFVKPTMPIDELLTQMSNHRRNLAIVKDETGTLLGIVTIEDILEQLVGEIYDEDDIGGDADV